MTNQTGRLVVAATSLTFTFGLTAPCSAAGTAAVTDLPSLIWAIETQRALLNRISIECESLLIEGPQGAVALSRERFVTDGTRFLYSNDYAFGLEEGARQFRRLVSFDGVSGLVASGSSRGAMQFTSTEDMAQHFDQCASDFFAACAWFPSHSLTNRSLPSGDLLAILTSGSAAVRTGTEVVSGYECAVVDFSGTDGVVRGTWWLALERGALPVRLEVRGADGALALTRTIDEFVALPNGAWLPASGQRLVGPDEATAELAAGLRYEFRLLPDALGAPSADISDPEASDFDPSPLLMPGTIVWSSDGSVGYIVSDADLGRAADRQIAWELGDSSGFPDRSATPFPYSAPAVIGSAAGLGGLLLGIGVALRRKHDSSTR